MIISEMIINSLFYHQRPPAVKRPTHTSPHHVGSAPAPLTPEAEVCSQYVRCFRTPAEQKHCGGGEDGGRRRGRAEAAGVPLSGVQGLHGAGQPPGDQRQGPRYGATRGALGWASVKLKVLLM